MSETAISASEAAKDFLGLLARVERERQPAILLREGKPVATLSPVPGVATDY
jgi:antitoxin (DNA-binding transcriptional repressor) of toxin-antitoxin stability system